MNKLALIIAAAALCAAPTLAADHITPEDPAIAKDDDAMFAAAYRPDVEVRMATVGLRRLFTGIRFYRATGTYRVFSLEGDYGFKREAVDGNSNPVWSVIHCDKPIDAVLARRIIHLWNTMLREAHATTPEEKQLIYPTGTQYHFWSSAGLAGGVLSPGDKTKPRMLADIAERLGGVCAKPDEIDKLRASVDALSEKLKRP